jgi:hypothetical protein
MKILCVDNSGFEDFLTAGKTYEVEAIGVNGYCIATDKGRSCWYGESKFRIV